MSDRKRLLAGVAFLVLLGAASSGADNAKVSGWTEVSKRWPLDQTEYFVATKKAHHFVEVKLPERVESDLSVRLEYYFSYAQVRPTLQMVGACSDGVDVIGPEQVQGQWLEHRAVVKQADCGRRDTIEYNVLLHDANDVFAWRLMEVKSLGGGAGEHQAEPAKEPAVADWSAAIEKKKEAEEARKKKEEEEKDQATGKKPDQIVEWPKDLINKPGRRVKRAAAEINLSCRPSSCNRDQFHLSKFFLLLAKGLPQLSGTALERGARFYLSTDNQPLSIEQESSEDFSDVNSCLELELYMEPGTRLEFFVEQDEKDRLLETIERVEGDALAGKWDLFKRCVSDYMPKLQAANNHRLRWTFKPKAAPGGQRIAMLVKPDAFPLRKQYPPLEYIQNIQNLDSASQLDDFWVLDKDGVQKPRVDFWAGGESSSEAGAQKRVLRIYDIEPRQDSFDLTSRWIKVQDVEILENPLFLMYRADKADWIKSVVFEYQNAKQSDWVAQEVYVRSDGSEAVTNSTTNDGPASEQDKGKGKVEEASADTKHILLPIKIKGLTKDDEFRFRIRHLVDRERQASDSQRLQLSIGTLAFGDACAETNFCLNGGACRSTGPARAQCTCLAGYSGQHCQQVRPCEVLYEGRTGKALCESVGAECVQDLPVFRCRWPNDKFFKCDPLYRQTDTGGYEPIAAESTDPNSGESPNTLAELKERADNQAKLIIIMGVFMAALLLFGVVIVANVVSRLMRTKRRLKRAQGDNVELARRSLPTTSSAGARPALGARHKLAAAGAPAAAYSNQSFDVE